MGEKLCKKKVTAKLFCENLFILIFGASDQMDLSLFPTLLGHIPAGSSINQLIHYAQLVKSGHFRQFDHGLIKNLIKYKHFSPPDYNLKNVQVPVAVYHAESDALATVKDVHILIEKLPNVVQTYLVPHVKFNHADFAIGINLRTLVNDVILKTIKAITNNTEYDLKEFLPRNRLI